MTDDGRLDISRETLRLLLVDAAQRGAHDQRDRMLAALGQHKDEATARVMEVERNSYRTAAVAIARARLLIISEARGIVANVPLVNLETLEMPDPMKFKERYESGETASGVETGNAPDPTATREDNRGQHKPTDATRAPGNLHRRDALTGFDLASGATVDG